MKTVVEEINELKAMAIPDLVARYEEVFGKPPRVKNKDHLWRRIAWRIQEQRFGGLPGPARRALNALTAEIELPVQAKKNAVTGRVGAPGARLGVGATLVREWHGHEYRVRVVDGGFELDSVIYKSLSAAARAITGQAWNGPLFFHLRKRGKK
jgi:hypothetical protein